MQKHNYGLYGVMVGLLFLQALKRPSTKVIIVTNTKKFPGYTITNCNYINIVDSTIAKRFAFDSGKIKNVNDIFIILFGSSNCGENIGYRNQEEAQFTFNLLLYYLAGAVFANFITIDSAIKGLNDSAKEISASGYKIEFINENVIKNIITSYQ